MLVDAEIGFFVDVGGVVDIFVSVVVLVVIVDDYVVVDIVW